MDATLCSRLLFSANLGHTAHSTCYTTLGPSLVGQTVGARGSALEAQLLVLGGNVIPEELQGLAHSALSIRSKVSRVPLLQDFNDDF